MAEKPVARSEILKGVTMTRVRAYGHGTVNVGNYNSINRGFEMEALLPEGANSAEAKVVASRLKTLVETEINNALVYEIDRLLTGTSEVYNILHQLDPNATPLGYEPDVAE